LEGSFGLFVKTVQDDWWWCIVGRERGKENRKPLVTATDAPVLQPLRGGTSHPFYALLSRP
jgi:hypothetical protein